MIYKILYIDRVKKKKNFTIVWKSEFKSELK